MKYLKVYCEFHDIPFDWFLNITRNHMGGSKSEMMLDRFAWECDRPDLLKVTAVTALAHILPQITCANAETEFFTIHKMGVEVKTNARYFDFSCPNGRSVKNVHQESQRETRPLRGPRGAREQWVFCSMVSGQARRERHCPKWEWRVQYLEFPFSWGISRAFYKV